MEARMEVVASPTRLWWSNLGKWQVLAVLLILGVFFATMGVTGDTKDAVAAFTTAAVFAVVVVIVAAFTTAAVFAVGTVTFTVATVGVAAVGAAAVGAATFTAIAFTTAAAVATVIVADEISGVSKKAIWLSYMGEFLFILLPMLWVVRG